MINHWIDAIKLEIAEKAKLEHGNLDLEKLVKKACKKLRIARIMRKEAESMQDYGKRLIMHFDLGHKHDKQPSDRLTRIIRKDKFDCYNNRRMGL